MTLIVQDHLLNCFFNHTQGGIFATILNTESYMGGLKVPRPMIGEFYYECVEIKRGDGIVQDGF